MDFATTSFAALRHSWVTGASKPSAWFERQWERMERLESNPLTSTSSWISLTAEVGARAAAEADRRFANGNARLLDGMMVGVKDNFAAAGIRMTAASKMLENFVPSYDAAMWERWNHEGACMIGKASMDEFAMGSSNRTSFFGPVTNPWRRHDGVAVVPGGSSGGSAAAVAAGYVTAALGSDTGGSIRQPASFCGLVGIKPTYGRCSRYGMVAFASSLDQAGVLARSMEDAVEALLPMMGHDPRDQTTSTLPVPDLKSVLRGSIEGMVVGIPREYRHPSLSPEIRGWWDQSVDWLKAEGAQIREVSLPHTEAALPTYYVIAPAEASSNLARYDGVRFGHRTPLDDLPFEAWITRNRSEGFGEEVRRRILVGTYVLSSQCYDHYFAQAQRVRGLICQDFEAAFREVDVLLTPTTPTEAFALDAVLDPLSMYINDLFTIPASLAGLPALSVPVGLSDRGLPLGMQCIARPWHEADMVRVACALERAAGFVCHPAHREGSRES